MMWPLVFLAAASAVPSVAPRYRVVANTFVPAIPSRYRWVFVGVALVLGFVLVRNQAAGLLAAAMVAGTCYRLVRAELDRRAATRRGAAVAQLATVIVGELRSGSSMVTAVGRAGADAADPRVRECVAVAARRAAAGGSGAQALVEQAARAPELAGIGRAWRAAEEHGIAQAELIAHAAKRLEASQAHRRKVVASIQGAQVTAIILSVLPVFGIVLGFAMGVNVPAFLLGGGLGGLILVAGVALECGGLLVAHQIMERAACT